jgi:hypothetical protein
MTSMVLGDSTLESLTPSVNAPLNAHAEGATRVEGILQFLQSWISKYGTFEESKSFKVESATPQWKEECPLGGAHFLFPIHTCTHTLLDWVAILHSYSHKHTYTHFWCPPLFQFAWLLNCHLCTKLLKPV